MYPTNEYQRVYLIPHKYVGHNCERGENILSRHHEQWFTFFTPLASIVFC